MGNIFHLNGYVFFLLLLLAPNILSHQEKQAYNKNVKILPRNAKKNTQFWFSGTLLSQEAVHFIVGRKFPPSTYK